jgi:hypothetical protein
MGYFSDLEPSSGRSGSFFRLLLTIDKHVLELRDLRQEVENQKRLLENLEREVRSPLDQIYLKLMTKCLDVDHSTSPTGQQQDRSPSAAK